MKKLTLAVLQYDLEQVQKSIDEHKESLTVGKSLQNKNAFPFNSIQVIEEKIEQFTEVKTNLEACIAWVKSKPQ